MVKVQWSHVGLCPVCFVKVWCRCVVSCVVRVQYNNAMWSSDTCKKLWGRCVLLHDAKYHQEQ